MKIQTKKKRKKEERGERVTQKLYEIVKFYIRFKFKWGLNKFKSIS